MGVSVLLYYLQMAVSYHASVGRCAWETSLRLPLCLLKTVNAFFGGCWIVPKSCKGETGNQERKVALPLPLPLYSFPEAWLVISVPVLWIPERCSLSCRKRSRQTESRRNVQFLSCTCGYLHQVLWWTSVAPGLFELLYGNVSALADPHISAKS